MAKYIEVPLTDSPYYTLSMSIEGNSYILEFIYNERVSLYFINLYDSDKNPIVLGAALVPEYPILLDYKIPNMTGCFALLNKSSVVQEAYKTYPDSLSNYYYFVYMMEE